MLHRLYCGIFLMRILLVDVLKTCFKIVRNCALLERVEGRGNDLMRGICLETVGKIQ